MRAYGDIIYIRSLSKSGYVSVKLFTAKSRIFSLKEITIPRLELLGNLILARLMHSVKIAIENDVTKDDI